MNGTNTVNAAGAAKFAGTSAGQPSGRASYLKFGQAEDKMERSASSENLKEGQLAPDELGFSIRHAITRPIKMALVRPTGWAEMALYFMTGGLAALFFPVKHALEGLLGVDSIFMKRGDGLTNRISGSFSKRGQGRTLVEVLKAKFGGDRSATAT